MRTISIDIETYSSVDLSEAGVYRYAEAPDFEVLLIGYSVDGGPVEVLDAEVETFTRVTDFCRLLEDPAYYRSMAEAVNPMGTAMPVNGSCVRSCRRRAIR